MPTLREVTELVTRKALELAAQSGNVGIYTEVGQSSVMVGLATKSGVCAVAIDRAEYDGMKILEMIERGMFHDKRTEGSPPPG